ncbi:MAG: GNAT family N-acetyltransferase [Methanotrichaceae archaeon]|nr:GNAT family N-acetyltransferase [Methanotrichaceae archaeon]
MFFQYQESRSYGEPQYLVQALLDYVQKYPKSLLDAELMNIVTLGVAPYTDEKFGQNFRLNSFFISDNIRNAVNILKADYTPIFLSALLQLIRSGRIPIDVALVQASPPDSDGILNLGISVDIVKAAAENASTLIVQANSFMPRIRGDGEMTIEDVDFFIPKDEPLLEYIEAVPGDIAQRIGKYVARIVEDESTIQVGHGSIPNAIVSSLSGKRHLGVHTELLSDGLAGLMENNVVDNSKKSINPNKTIATFCMGTSKTYQFINQNPDIEFRTIDYTNNPLVIAQNNRMTAINSALEIDLTGQATAESLGKTYFSGIGGQADFMRGTVLAPGGKTILALPSLAENENASRIVPFLQEVAGVTLTRGDIHYVVTEFGIAYLHGKCIRERAMDLIAIAHPKFRSRLIEEAKKLHIIYPDQAFIPGEQGEYPEMLESSRITKTSLKVLLRLVKMSDEPLLKDFFYSLSEESMYQRFFSARKDIPHDVLQNYVIVNYTIKMILLAIAEIDGKEIIAGMGQYSINKNMHTADVALIVRDKCQNQGIGAVLLSYLTYLAKKQGLLGFTAEILQGNDPVFRLFEKMGFGISKKSDSGIIEMVAMFN